MSHFPRAGARRSLATPAVAYAVSSLGADASRATTVRPWTHAEYTRWRRAAFWGLVTALLVEGVLFLCTLATAGRAVATGGNDGLLSGLCVMTQVPGILIVQLLRTGSSPTVVDSHFWLSVFTAQSALLWFVVASRLARRR